MLEGIINFLKHGVWEFHAQTLPRHRRLLLRTLRIALLALRGFREDRCQLRASALTFYSLLSIVPVVAMAFGVAKGFGFEQRLHSAIDERFANHDDVAGYVIRFAESMLDSTSGGLIAGMGVLLLFWTVIKLFDNIEQSFNDIWGVRKGRGFARKLADYLAAMLISPMLLVVSSSLTVFIAHQVNKFVDGKPMLDQFGVVFGTLIHLMPVVVIWLLFSFLYSFMPNTSVGWRAALVGGFFAAVSYQIVQRLYVVFQVGVAKYNAIYGSFAALPLFLIWVQTSWVIVLLGAEIAFASDNVEEYQAEVHSREASPRQRKILGLRLVELCAKAFARGEPPPSVQSISHDTHAPIRLVRALLYELTEANELSAVKSDDDSTEHYQPAMPVDMLTVGRVLHEVEMKGGASLPEAAAESLQPLADRLQAFDSAIDQSPDNVRVTDL
jgi:membrane protein